MLLMALLSNDQNQADEFPLQCPPGLDAEDQLHWTRLRNRTRSLLL